MNNLTVIENELVPVYETSTGEKAVYGSELHEVLGVKSNYREWIKRRALDIDAEEDVDFTTVEIPTVSGGAPKKDHIIKLDIAKEMAMLERNDKGKEVRRYFIRVIEELDTKYELQVKDMYVKTLDLSMALRENARLEEVERKLAERRAQQERERAEAEKRAAAEAQKQQDVQLEGQISFTDAESFEACMNPPESEIGQCITGIGKQAFEECVARERQWVSFAANLTMADAVALKEFFESRNIEFKAL